MDHRLASRQRASRRSHALEDLRTPGHRAAGQSPGERLPQPANVGNYSAAAWNPAVRYAETGHDLVVEEQRPMLVADFPERRDDFGRWGTFPTCRPSVPESRPRTHRSPGGRGPGRSVPGGRRRLYRAPAARCRQPVDRHTAPMFRPSRSRTSRGNAPRTSASFRAR